ncbi:MAG TPA: NBR1-Ig-like domain-containing protein, partial [Anaerolineales bacterium]|nr:NBR1-Ig-like domain-containing protein [Anaerolineales bacterium]
IAMRAEIEMGSGIAVMDVQRENGKLLGAQPATVLQAFADGPRWSPDGTKLVYVSAEGAGGWITYIAELSSSSASKVPGIPENATDPDWSPDGNQIVFSNYTDPANQINDLYVVNTDGSGFTQLTNTPTLGEGEPRWSPDGQKIVFTAFDGDSGNFKKDIFIMNRDGTDIFRVTTDAGSDFDPGWSPDGKQIVFVSDRHENNDGNYEVYVINVDGTGELRLTNNHFVDRWPTWRTKQPDDIPVADCQPAVTLAADVTIPAGTRFATPQSFTKVWRVKNSGTCTWTPSNYTLRFVEGEQMGDLTQVMIPGAIQPGATVDIPIPQVAPDAAGRHSAYWQLFHRDGQAVPGPDGNPVKLAIEIEVLQPGQAILPQPLYFLSEQSGSAQIWRMETDARTVTQITNEPQPVITLDVSATGSIAYVSQYQIFVADANGQNRQVIANLESDIPVRKLAWSPDGTRLAYPSKGIHVYDMTIGEDKLLIADNDTRAPDLVRYEPLEWSPDGSKLLANTYLWEGFELNIISAANGTVLAKLPSGDAAWNADSQSVYIASAEYPGLVGIEPGLWRGPATGEAPQPLLSQTAVWSPFPRRDGTLAFFMYQPVTPETKEYAAALYTSASDGSQATGVNSWPITISANDTFDGLWAEDGQSILVQLVRPALDISEVLLISADENPPVFLTSEPKAFWWGK